LAAFAPRMTEPVRAHTILDVEDEIVSRTSVTPTGTGIEFESPTGFPHDGMVRVEATPRTESLNRTA
jgi:hypothetical protein